MRFRTNRYSVIWLCCVLGGGLGAACGETKPEPEIASSAPLASYAQSYPEEVEGAVSAFGEAEVTAKELDGKLGAFADEYKDEVDHGLVADALERADQVGRSHAYRDQLVEVEATRTFYEQEKDVIRRKVAGAAQHTAQQAGCDAEVGGAAAAGLDRSMKEQLAKRLREGNDAHRIVERHREALGKPNAAVLEDQIDQVALASYLVHIQMVEQKVRLVRLIEEADQVEQTADELIAEEQAYQNESGRSDAEIKAATERIEAMKQAKSRLGTVVRHAKKTSEKQPDRVARSQKAHQDALAKLLDNLRKRAPK